MNAIDRMFTKDPLDFAGKYISYISAVLSKIDRAEIARFIETILDARARGATIYFIGNGGSASTASHFANDLTIGTNDYETPFRVVSLSDNNAVLTAIGNDYGFDDVFSRQIRVLGRTGDVLVAISVSGNSPNLLKAFEAAKALGVKTVAITAVEGGKMRGMADEGVHVPTENKEYGPAEDAHLILNHLIGAYLMRVIKAS